MQAPSEEKYVNLREFECRGEIDARFDFGDTDLNAGSED